MAKLENLTNSKAIILMLGKPKSGKTILASQFPNLHYVDLDKGLSSTISMMQDQKCFKSFPVYQIDEAPTDDPDVLDFITPALAKQDAWVKVRKLLGMLGTRLTKDDFIVIDPITRLGEYLVTHIKKTTGHKQLQIQDWGIFVEEFSELFEMLRSSLNNANIIMLAHENPVKDEMTGILERQVLLPTSTKFRLPGMVDEFIYMKSAQKLVAGAKKRVIQLQTVPDAGVSTGSRSLIPDMDFPTYEKIRPYLERSLGRKLPDPTWTPKE